jgi:hypothetical protein
MKYKTTRKAIRARYGTNIYIVNMGGADKLLGLPDAYITRVDGWACDVWTLSGICFTEGDAPIGENVGYDFCQKYINKARKILSYKNRWSWRRKQAQILKIRDEFINKVKKGEY